MYYILYLQTKLNLCLQVTSIVLLRTERTNVEEEGFNNYRLCEGAATFATSITTVLLSIPSITCYGEWSIGWDLDCYWHFDKIEDQFLEHILVECLQI